MLALLPIMALGTYVLALRERLVCWREAILMGAVLWGAVLVGITEALSVVHGLTAFGLAAAWLAALLAGVGFAMLGNHRVRAAWALPRLEWPDGALLGPLGALVLVLGATAIAGPPNTWDAMTYHMARIVHWTQAASLAPYPTHIPRQLYLQPGAELVLLHLQILSGGDHLAGGVQWASMVGALIGTSLIARDLGAGRLGALCATLFTASIPIGMLESTSTQNDYVVAFWLVCVMAFALRITRSFGSAPAWATTAAFGASIGLALLTKATAYIVTVPIVAWVLVCLMRRSGWRGFRPLVVAGVIALALNSGFYARNLLVFGTPVGPLDEGDPTLRYMNEAFTPPLLLSNLVRDVGINFNATPVVAVNVRALNFVRLVHAWLGVDIADPRTTWGQEVFIEQPVGLAFDENFASNPLHVVLIVVALAAAWPLRHVVPRSVGAYALVVASGFALFTIVLRWQPWDTRLELPFLVLGAPLVGSLAERSLPARLVLLLAVGLLVSMLPWVAYNQARPLVGPRSILMVSRDDRYFTNRRTLRAGYLGAVGYLAARGCARVGFISSVDGWEYPLWPLLHESVPDPVEIEQVGVTNVSATQASVADEQFHPCAVFALGTFASRESLETNGATYRSTWSQLDPLAPLEQVAVLTEDGR